MKRKPLSEEAKALRRAKMQAKGTNKHSKEAKEKISRASKKMWNNPEAKQKHSEAIKKALANPETRQKLSDKAKEFWSTEDGKLKKSAASKKMWSSQQYKLQHSNMLKELWQSAVHKQKVIKSMKLTLSSKRYKLKQSQSSILAWKNNKQKRLDSMKQFYVKQKQEFIEKYNLSKELLEEKFIENNKFNIDAFCEYCNKSYSFCMNLKCYFDIKAPNIQHQCKIQQEIFDFISQCTQATFNDRQTISPKELDILIPERNIAIEFDGLLYHSTGYSDIPGCNGINELPSYHLEKTQACNEKGIKLFHIFEDEWRDKKEIWKSVLLNALGKSNRVYARKCIARLVSSKEAKQFLEANHLQGSCNSSINIGLYLENTLISLMTFGKSRYNKQYQYELLRFCNILNTSVVGGASKLLKYFIKKHQPQSIISYANLRWSSGKLYENLGFEKIGQSSPNYFYFNENKILRSRIEFQKHKLKDKLEKFDEKLTESENMYNNGYRKIYDCGNLIYVMFNF